MKRRRDFPKEIDIGNNRWRVRFVRHIKDPSGAPGMTTGLCDPSDHTIYIRQGLPPRERFQTLIHELLHACEYEYEFNISHKTVYDLEDALASLWEANFGF